MRLDDVRLARVDCSTPLSLDQSCGPARVRADRTIIRQGNLAG